MKKEERIRAFSLLGERLRENDPRMDELIAAAARFNPWFRPEEVRYMMNAIAETLSGEGLERFLASYDLDAVKPKTVAVIMAGNIPLVGFHDFMCVLLSGHQLVARLSSDDKLLLPAVAEILFEIEPRFREAVRFTEGRIDGMNSDAIIATGSNNSSRYFEHYFAKYPHIIRKNRHGIAVLSGNESREQLEALGDDIFRYMGLGCRNVTKLFVPRGYSFNAFFESILSWGEKMISHTKYMNNYEYHRSLYLLNSEKLLDNNFILLREDTRLASPPGVLYYEFYDDVEVVKERLRIDSENIQCVVGDPEHGIAAIPFGKSQSPGLADYADGVDTMQFLVETGKR